MTCAAIFLVGSGLAGGFSEAAARTVKEIRIGENKGVTRFVLEVSAPVSYKIFSLPDPHRVVIDLSETAFAASYAVRGGGVIDRYRFGLFEPGTSRLVLDLKDPAVVATHFTIPARGNTGFRVVIDMKTVSRAEFMASVRRSDESAAAGAGKSPPVSVKPRSASSRRVIAIDPGHGGVDPGAIGVNGVHEKNVTLNAARVIKAELEKTGRYDVVLTRDRDIFLPLRQRFEVARRAGADLFISLHADSFRTPDVSGASVYTLSERASDREAELLAAKENKADVIAGIDLAGEAPEVSSILIDLARRETMNYSAHFASVLVGELSQAVTLRRNTHRFAGFVVLKAPDVPSVLVEMGYLSNPQDANSLVTRRTQERIAQSIRRAVDNYFLKVASHENNLL